jgi:hypothetical protein
MLCPLSYWGESGLDGTRTRDLRRDRATDTPTVLQDLSTPEGIRTLDLYSRSVALFPLSYGRLVAALGFEPRLDRV